MNSDKVLRAEEFARRCHAGQVRKGAAQELYTVHLEEVASYAQPGYRTRLGIVPRVLSRTLRRDLEM